MTRNEAIKELISKGVKFNYDKYLCRDWEDKDKYFLKEIPKRTFLERLYNWTLGTTCEIETKEIIFTWLNKRCFAFDKVVLTDSGIGKFLSKRGFTEKSGGGYMNGFVEIDENEWTIKHSVSKKPTIIYNNIDDYIKNFKRI